MAYILTEENQKIVNECREFMQTEVAPHVAHLDREGIIPMDLYKKGFERGYHKMELGKELGGLGLDYVTVGAMLEEMAKVDAGYATAMMSASLSMKCILWFGTEEQKKLAAEKLLPGGFAAFALTEEEAGSDAGACTTTAVKDGDEWVINGKKHFITSGKYSNLLVVFAKTDPNAGNKGLTAFIIDPDAPGLTIGKEEDKMGIRTVSVCDLHFDNVRVPADRQLGALGQGFKIAMTALNMGRVLVGATAVGIAQSAVDLAVAAAKERKTFGKPISAYQGISFMIADMEIGVETARQMCAHAFTRYMRHENYTREAAIAKAYASDVANINANRCAQIMGGHGFMRDYPAEKLIRDAKIFQIFEGTNEIQRMTIAGAVLR